MTVAMRNPTISATAGPLMPSAGNGPQPKVSPPARMIWRMLVAIMTAAGRAMLPVPRTMEAKELASQRAIPAPKAISA